MKDAFHKGLLTPVDRIGTLVVKFGDMNNMLMIDHSSKGVIIISLLSSLFSLLSSLFSLLSHDGDANQLVA